MRQSTFTVDAESVQGNPGATVTFRAITVGDRQEYLDTPEVDNIVMLQRHVVSWSGIVDDNDNELPGPVDEPKVISALYMHEMNKMHGLLWVGPLEDSPKN